MIRPPTISLILAASAIALLGRPVFPDDNFTERKNFRVETEVFAGDSTAPVSINQTLFLDNLVYDFRLSADGSKVLEATIFDTSQRSFVLLDLTRHIRWNIDNLQLLRIVDGMKKDLQSNDSTGFLMFEDAREDFQLDAGQITVENQFITYRLVGRRPDDDRMLQRYHEFLDHYTRLSATDPRRMPPFARMHLNRAIKKYGLIPKEIVLDVRESEYNRHPFTASSRHRLELTLSDADEARIEWIRKELIKSRQVELAEYREIEPFETSEVGAPERIVADPSVGNR